jgi:hypothetical protein
VQDVTVATALPTRHRAHGLTAYQFAQLYRKLGFHIFPLLPASKKPAVKWGGAKLLPNTEPDYWKWRPNYGIAIATGPSSGLFVYDVDAGVGKRGGSSHVAYTDRFGPFPTTPCVLTGTRGLHYYFSCPGFDFPNSTSKVGPGLDIKTRGGFVVAPSPSPHPRTGRQYYWIAAPWDVDIAPGPTWLLRAILPPPPKPLTTVDPEHIRRARLQHGEGGPLERARLYIDAMPPMVEGQGGRRKLWLAAVACCRKLALDDAEALAVLREYNARADPPWTDEELKQFIRDARSNSIIPLGCWL